MIDLDNRVMRANAWMEGFDSAKAMDKKRIANLEYLLEEAFKFVPVYSTEGGEHPLWVEIHKALYDEDAEASDWSTGVDRGA